MDYIEIFEEGISTLTLNKTRTGLAVLGIVIGIGSVIALLSLGAASQKAVESQIQSLGANLLTVSPMGQRNTTVRSAGGSGTTLTLEDAEAMKSSSKIKNIANVSPELSQRAQISTGGSNTNTQVIGVYPEYSTVHKTTLQYGVFISKMDVDAMSKVAVLGPQVVTDLFGENVTNPVGKTIRINGQNLRVIGVTNSKGGTGFMNQDDVVYVPLTLAQKQLFGAKYLSSIALEAKSDKVMVDAQDEVGYFLLGRHKIDDPSSADFSIFSQQDILNTASSMTGTFTTLLSGIAAISLVVGGIGIMNIMLVTVTERTREIGLRKALGAKKKTITTQFLIESIILTLSGGIVGVVLGILTSYLISIFMSLAFVISFESIALASAVSATIGIVFGWYPAKKASELQPIEALRYE